MNLVTHEELGAILDRWTEALEAWRADLVRSAGGEPQQNFTREEAAAYLRMGLRTLDRYAAKGLLRRVKIGEGPKATVLFRRVDLDAFLEDHTELTLEEAREKVRDTSTILQPFGDDHGHLGAGNGRPAKR